MLRHWPTTTRHLCIAASWCTVQHIRFFDRQEPKHPPMCTSMSTTYCGILSTDTHRSLCDDAYHSNGTHVLQTYILCAVLRACWMVPISSLHRASSPLWHSGTVNMAKIHRRMNLLTRNRGSGAPFLTSQQHTAKNYLALRGTFLRQKVNGEAWEARGANIHQRQSFWGFGNFSLIGWEVIRLSKFEHGWT